MARNSWSCVHDGIATGLLRSPWVARWRLAPLLFVAACGLEQEGSFSEGQVLQNPPLTQQGVEGAASIGEADATVRVGQGSDEALATLKAGVSVDASLEETLASIKAEVGLEGQEAEGLTPAGSEGAKTGASSANSALIQPGHSEFGFEQGGGHSAAGLSETAASGVGSGVGRQEGEQTFYQHELVWRQPVGGKVDILWVIDSSLSMAEEQDYLGRNFNSFISVLSESGQNFQTAITTTDICENSLPALLSERACPFDYGGNPSTHLRGRYVGAADRKILHADESDLLTLFNSYAQVGTEGSNFEHGLKAVELALKKEKSGENPALIRSEAFLSVIIVGDEDDDGTGLNRVDPFLKFNPTAEGLTTFSYSPNQLIAYLENVKGPGKFAISTITGVIEDNGKLCTSAHSQPAEAGSAYINAALKTGGQVQSICETNWGNSLQLIGRDLQAQMSQIKLSHQALLSSIYVLVNGVESHSWELIPGNNSIKFFANAIPAPGAEVKVIYESLEE